MPEERTPMQTQNQDQPQRQQRKNAGQFQKGSDRAREAGRKGGKKSS